MAGDKMMGINDVQMEEWVTGNKRAAEDEVNYGDYWM